MWYDEALMQFQWSFHRLTWPKLVDVTDMTFRKLANCGSQPILRQGCAIQSDLWRSKLPVSVRAYTLPSSILPLVSCSWCKVVNLSIY